MKKQIILIAVICSVIFISGCISNQGNNSTANYTATNNNVTNSNTTIQITDPSNGQIVPKIYNYR